MKLRFSRPPGAHTRYAQTGFEKNIGKTIHMNIFDLTVAATLRSVVVAPDGSDAEFTVEISDPAACVMLSAYHATGALNHMSIVEET